MYIHIKRVLINVDKFKYPGTEFLNGYQKCLVLKNNLENIKKICNIEYDLYPYTKTEIGNLQFDSYTKLNGEYIGILFPNFEKEMIVPIKRIYVESMLGNKMIGIDVNNVVVENKYILLDDKFYNMLDSYKMI